MINPYANTNWNGVQIKSVSHTHVLSQSDIDKVSALGYEHIPVSHYLPSSPRYPLENFFSTIPEGVISSPNSEKVRMYGEVGHICALGSFLEGYGWTAGDASASWQTVFKEIFANLQYADGGGITLNHPSDMDFALRTKMLDFDKRVLGIEIYNNMMDVHESITDYCTRFVELWNRILNTGRKCWGFCAIDWPSAAYEPLMGSNMLIVPEKTEYECLKAYRNGSFYCVIRDNGIRFNSITADNTHVECIISESATLRIVTQDGIVKTETGTGISYTFDSGDIYARIEVSSSDDFKDTMFSQPIILKPSNHYGDLRKKQLLLL